MLAHSRWTPRQLPFQNRKLFFCEGKRLLINAQCTPQLQMGPQKKEKIQESPWGNPSSSSIRSRRRRWYTPSPPGATPHPSPSGSAKLWMCRRSQHHGPAHGASGTLNEHRPPPVDAGEGNGRDCLLQRRKHATQQRVPTSPAKKPTSRKWIPPPGKRSCATSQKQRRRLTSKAHHRARRQGRRNRKLVQGFSVIFQSRYKFIHKFRCCYQPLKNSLFDMLIWHLLLLIACSG